MPSKIKPPSLDTQAHALYSDPHLYKYATTISRVGFGRGPDHPAYGRDLACLALDIEARIYGNRQKVQAVNADRRVWERKRQIVRVVTGRDLLPANPPTADVVRMWRRRWVPRTKDPRNSPRPPALSACLDQVMKLGLKRARKFGQFPAGVERDFANPDPRHLRRRRHLHEAVQRKPALDRPRRRNRSSPPAAMTSDSILYSLARCSTCSPGPSTYFWKSRCSLACRSSQSCPRHSSWTPGATPGRTSSNQPWSLYPALLHSRGFVLRDDQGPLCDTGSLLDRRLQ